MSKKKTFSDLIKSSDVPVLVDFYADWCGPCKTLSPIVQEVSSALHGRVKVIKVNVDKNQSASQKYGIRGVPTLILFKKGDILWRQAGVLSKRDLQQTVERYLN
ncbi:MAG: thioredoxin [Cyclobacteriaceae bacterium]|nr:thioredoxin [Cyclobacteriaceae bacterium]